jgi:hypothetical protein
MMFAGHITLILIFQLSITVLLWIETPTPRESMPVLFCERTLLAIVPP